MDQSTSQTLAQMQSKWQLPTFDYVQQVAQYLQWLTTLEPRDNRERDMLEQAATLLAWQSRTAQRFRERLQGDMAGVPDAALHALVLQHFGQQMEKPTYEAAMALASDVRLVSFFRALAEPLE